jgi:hypothetical protein
MEEQNGRLATCIGGWYSAFGDGSTDRRMCESEILYVRYLHKNQNGDVELRDELYGLQPIDTKMSRDGKSFDAQATKASYDAALTQRMPGNCLRMAWVG